MCVAGDSWNIITQCPEVCWLPTPEKGENGNPTVAIFLCLASYPASQLCGTTSLRNQECRLSFPPIDISKGSGTGHHPREGRGILQLDLGGNVSGESPSRGYGLSETHRLGIQRSIRFWQSSALSELGTMCISGSDKSCLSAAEIGEALPVLPVFPRCGFHWSRHSWVIYFLCRGGNGYWRYVK